MEFAGFVNRDVVKLTDIDKYYEKTDIIKRRMFSDSELILEKCDNGLYHYYARQLRDSDEHKAGYHWSSRVGCINYWFTEEMIDVMVDCRVFCMPILELRKILPKEYVIVKNKTNDEPTFKVIERKNLEIDKDWEARV